ncbi:SDR family NAD(P)-dependent oxidoreductase [Vibrio breoganii]|uniref:SDR family NAD(P)-dependent oxidoreductase n=1 Tax=Vibrio breoganii TaxID=553239 RepID=UPI0010BD2973|nr:SDR family NAD(P)-dependent oxidoreductase [Vibrio breoganii]TKG23449.1 SDR family NAD(P)-dependent oxidoreductase [Vibrio breoganii]
MGYVLVTGASEGIGKAIAYKFARQHHPLILVSRQVDKLNVIKEDIEDRYGIEVIICPADLAVPQAVDEMYDRAMKHEIEVFVNNAGFGDYNRAWDADIDQISKMIDVNVKALTRLSLRFIQDHKKKPVTLINVSSAMGYAIYSDAVAYSATKFYVSAFTEGIAQNLKEGAFPLRVKLLAPGPVTTEFEKNAITKSSMSESEWEGPHTAEEMANFAYRLYASDQIVSLREGETMRIQDPLFGYE